MTKRQSIPLAQKKLISLLFVIIITGGGTAYAEMQNCEVGDYSKGNWEYVNKDLNGSSQIYCSLPMNGPAHNLQLIADGYMATVSWMYTNGCNNPGYCPNGNFITTGENLKTLEAQCQEMYYASFQKKYENGCCYLREHATYGEWIPAWGLYQYGYRLQRWKCKPDTPEQPEVDYNYGQPDTCH